jgi:hypothetical protein
MRHAATAKLKCWSRDGNALALPHVQSHSLPTRNSAQHGQSIAFDSAVGFELDEKRVRRGSWRRQPFLNSARSALLRFGFRSRLRCRDKLNNNATLIRESEKRTWERHLHRGSIFSRPA